MRIDGGRSRDQVHVPYMYESNKRSPPTCTRTLVPEPERQGWYTFLQDLSDQAEALRPAPGCRGGLSRVGPIGGMTERCNLIPLARSLHALSCVSLAFATLVKNNHATICCIQNRSRHHNNASTADPLEVGCVRIQESRDVALEIASTDPQCATPLPKSEEGSRLPHRSSFPLLWLSPRPSQQQTTRPEMIGSTWPPNNCHKDYGVPCMISGRVIELGQMILEFSDGWVVLWTHHGKAGRQYMFQLA